MLKQVDEATGVIPGQRPQLLVQFALTRPAWQEFASRSCSTNLSQLFHTSSHGASVVMGASVGPSTLLHSTVTKMLPTPHMPTPRCSLMNPSSPQFFPQEFL